MFAGFGFYADLFFRHAEDFGDSIANCVSVWAYFGPLSENDAIQVHDLVAGGANASGGLGQHVGRVAVFVGWVSVGEHFADVADGGGTEEGIRDGVQEYVGVAVADGVLVVRDVEAAETQRSARRQTVRIVPNSYTDAQSWKSLSRNADLNLRLTSRLPQPVMVA